MFNLRNWSSGAIHAIVCLAGAHGATAMDFAFDVLAEGLVPLLPVDMGRNRLFPLCLLLVLPFPVFSVLMDHFLLLPLGMFSGVCGIDDVGKLRLSQQSAI